jgi:IclR family KDG regulon transcriptional repressor
VWTEPKTDAKAEDRGTSLRRALTLVTALGSEELVGTGGAGVSRLAAMTGQDKSQVSRTLRTLAEAGLVDRDPQTLLYRIGWQLFVLAARAGDQRLLSLAAPRLPQLVAETGERSHLSVLRGAGVLTLLTESPAHALQTVSWVGRVVPCHATSSGRALLLDHTREQLEALLGSGPLDRHGPHGVADVAGRVVAALNISGPAFRLRAHLDAACTSVAAAAEELSEQLGWSPSGRPPFRDPSPLPS